MRKKFKPINEKLPVFWHGGDYNPDQWLHTPEIIDEDIRMMKLANVNAVTLNVFSWALIEKNEGEFDFLWLDMVMDKLKANEIFVILATPSAAIPAWMSRRYNEVLRADVSRRRNDHGKRVNYCLTSKVYREKCAIIAVKLAERYKNHPTLLLWHVNNEMSGECYCPSCREGFRNWLKDKYKTLDNLNLKWWNAFWGHSYSCWEEVDAPGYINGSMDKSNSSQVLDWKRYMSYMNFECYKNEADAIRAIIPNAVVTTNTWRIFGEMDFSIFAQDVDVVGFDSYPQYHAQKDDWKIAQVFSFSYDAYRMMKNGKPFALVETSPGSMLAYTAQKLKRPGIHKMACLQAVAHGADTVLYFQWRKGRGGCEKTHGAVIDHVGHENTRVFRDVAEVGEVLKNLTPVIGTTHESEVAIIYDPQNLWLMTIDEPFHKVKQSYQAECVAHYAPFWSKGISVDVIHPTADFSKYKLVIAPLMYMQRDSFETRIKEYVKNGGSFVTTYLSNVVDEDNLCITGGCPGNLKDLFGIWSEEMDVLDEGEHLYSRWINDLPTVRDKTVMKICPVEKNELNLENRYIADTFCEIIHLKGARPIYLYNNEFYKGTPCVTVNDYGMGKAYYIATKNSREFNLDFYSKIIMRLGIKSFIKGEIPQGVTVQVRTDGDKRYVFVINFTSENKEIDLGCSGHELIRQRKCFGKISLDPYGVSVIEV